MSREKSCCPREAGFVKNKTSSSLLVILRKKLIFFQFPLFKTIFKFKNNKTCLRPKICDQFPTKIEQVKISFNLCKK